MARKPKPPTSTGNTIPAPTGLAVTVTNGAVVVTWDAVANATSYWIYRNGQVIAIYTTRSFTDNYAAAGYTWSYQVAAVVNSTLGPKSPVVSINSLNITYTAPA